MRERTSVIQGGVRGWPENFFVRGLAKCLNCGYLISFTKHAGGFNAVFHNLLQKKVFLNTWRNDPGPAVRQGWVFVVFAAFGRCV